MPFPRRYIYNDPSTKNIQIKHYQTKTIKSRKDAYSTQFRYKRYIYSWRFGYVDLIDQAQQKTIICPSGYTWGQGWGVLNKCWTGYKIAKVKEQSTENMLSFAKKIQDIQYDLGIKKTDFSHIGLPGELLVLYDKPHKEKRLPGQLGVEVEKEEEDTDADITSDNEEKIPHKEEVNTEEELQDIWLKDTIKTEHTE